MTSMSSARAQPAVEAAIPQASARLMMGRSGPRARAANRRARNSPEPAMTATSACADRRLADPMSGLGQPAAGGTPRRIGKAPAAASAEKRLPVRADHPRQAVPRGVDRGPAPVGGCQVGRIRVEIAQRQVDIESRRKELGGQANGRSLPERQLGSQRSTGACGGFRRRRAPPSADARCRSGPERRLCPCRAE